jgi:DNA-binding transcriptional ArsR family regulator
VSIEGSSPLEAKAKLFRALGDPSRLAVLEALRDGPKCVSELVAMTGLSQPNVSGHLSFLRDCNLVIREQRGRFAYYSLSEAAGRSHSRGRRCPTLKYAEPRCPLLTTASPAIREGRLATNLKSHSQHEYRVSAE